MKYQNIREEELKNKVGQDFFSRFDTTKIVGNIDFCVTPKLKDSRQESFNTHSLLWAEAKRGNFDLYTMFAQLILTIGKARTFDKYLPPKFLGAFDSGKIAFVPYNAIVDIFTMNDFNWNVTPSNHESKEFKLIYDRVRTLVERNHYRYDFLADGKELAFFIRNSIGKATESGKIHIDKNNFVPIYLRWLEQVKPTIDFNWEEGKKINILDHYFYLADLFVDDNNTSSIDDDLSIKNNLFVVFRDSHYEIARENLNQLYNATISFKDKKVYEQFWKKYKRPPLEEFQQYIIDRVDLLVPQDIRERRGAFFTPRIWVELSQQYIADVLGEDWQDECYVWDCAAGTGNLLAGLTNKYNIWASTLEMADVNVMHDRIDNGANLLKSHVFQFDFLNDDFSKLPQALQDIINDEEKRKKLVVYINPPYAEATNARTVTKTGENKAGTSIGNKTYLRYKGEMGKASNELFAQFLTRIYKEIPNSKIANFSKLKNLQSSNFSDFREMFRAKLEKIFLVPADTFDNVSGKFPIGFFVWDSNKQERFTQIEGDVYNPTGEFIGTKLIFGEATKSVNKWIKIFDNEEKKAIGQMVSCAPDFQHNIQLAILSERQERYCFPITQKNVMVFSVYYAVRKCIDATWLNDRDQFLYPNDGWKSDAEFQSDCLTYTLFSNNIQSKFGPNHWIPFTEAEVDAREKFASHFMTDFIGGKIKKEQTADLFSSEPEKTDVKRLAFSEEAAAVFDAGRDLWRYYHKQPGANPNASLYDIREHFQGRNDKGKMNSKSADETYNALIGKLRENLKLLARKIEPKVYAYGFLKN